MSETFFTYNTARKFQTFLDGYGYESKLTICVDLDSAIRETTFRVDYIKKNMLAPNYGVKKFKL